MTRAGERRRFSRRAWRAALACAVVAVALIAAGCGRRETAADRGVREGVLLQSLGAQEPSLDPHLARTLAEGAMARAVFEGLVVADAQTLEPRPGVAETWEASPDGLAYTFHLRAAARWSNGEAVTAQDFVASLRRALAPELGAANASLLHVLRGARAFHRGESKDFATVGVEAPDARTLRLTLEAPCPYFLPLLTHFIWLPVHVPSIRTAGPETSRTTRWTTPERFVGNGAFRPVEYRPGEFVRLVRNPAYWDAASVRLEGITAYVHSIESEERAFTAGQLHLTDALPVGKLPAYRERRPEVLRVAPSYGVYLYRVNVTRPPLDDARVRRALSAAIDRRVLTANLLSGAYAPAHALTPPGPAGYTPPALAPDDAALARRLLDEAGFGPGKPPRPLEILFNTSQYHSAIAVAVQEMWRRDLGLEVRLANREEQVANEERARLDYDVARGSWFGDIADPASFLEIFTTGNANNQTGWSNAGYDRLVAEAARTTDPARRLELFAQAETILLLDAPVIPVFIYSTIRLVDPRVRGWFDNPLDQHPYKAIFLEAAVP